MKIDERTVGKHDNEGNRLFLTMRIRSIYEGVVQQNIKHKNSGFRAMTAWAGEIRRNATLSGRMAQQDECAYSANIWAVHDFAGPGKRAAIARSGGVSLRRQVGAGGIGLGGSPSGGKRGG